MGYPPLFVVSRKSQLFLSSWVCTYSGYLKRSAMSSREKLFWILSVWIISSESERLLSCSCRIFSSMVSLQTKR